MDAIATFFGWFCIAVLCFGVACALFGVAVWAGGKLVDRFENAGAAKARRDISAQILSSIHWFGENEGAAQILRLAGERIRDGYRFDPSEAREEWRKRGAGP
jgi:hypothetical protein